MACETCAHWNEITDSDASDIGNCKRYPPMVVPDKRYISPWTHPITYKSDECGEYLPIGQT